MSRVCNFCPRTDLTDDDFYSTRNICKKCAIEKNNARARQLRASGICVDCQDPAEPGSSRCAACKGRHRARHHANRAKNLGAAKERRQRLKLAAMHAYGGPRCACCGTEHMEFLTIDHADGKGSEHRAKLLQESGWAKNRSSMCGSHFYQWLQRQGYPTGFRVLCFNCNFSLGHFGYCPHVGLVQRPTQAKLAAEAAE
jgi:hypothetical protein